MKNLNHLRIRTLLERGLGFGLTYRFLDDPPADPPKDPPADPPADPPKPPEDPPKPPVESITAKVDGQDQTFTLEEAQAALSKVSGADDRFKAASDLSKKAERGMRTQELMEKLQGGGDIGKSEIAELAGLMNLDPTVFTQTIDDPKDKKTTPAESKKLTLDDLDQELADDLRLLRQQNITGAKETIRTDSEKIVDKDEILGKMIVVAVDGGNEDFKSTVVDLVEDDVLRKIRNGDTYGTELIVNSVQRVRAQLKKFGIPDKAAKQAIKLALGPAESDSLEIHPDEPVKPVSPTDDGYENYFLKKYALLSQTVRDAVK